MWGPLPLEGWDRRAPYCWKVFRALLLVLCIFRIAPMWPSPYRANSCEMKECRTVATVEILQLIFLLYYVYKTRNFTVMSQSKFHRWRWDVLNESNERINTRKMIRSVTQVHKQHNKGVERTLPNYNNSVNTHKHSKQVRWLTTIQIKLSPFLAHQVNTQWEVHYGLRK